MKLKYKFVIREIDNNPVAVAVGRDNAFFRGMIKLNHTGGFIFEMLSGNTTPEAIVNELCRKYDVSTDEATDEVNDFLRRLRDEGLIEE